ncbi:unnamed protein product [Dibothriocephalus latus]|uniref:Ubiquitin-like domain-containing protein n=1 Tax=Dibothriocephalus latus TaxID=60516 RepID=A0A3P7QW49_DIBLA|nr:unnamed protein product [Dibothriocephalus latus]
MSWTLNIQCKRFGNFNLHVSENEGVLGVKQMIQCEQRVPLAKQNFTFDGQVPEDDFKLEDYGIKNGSTICLSLPLWFSRDMLLSITLPSGLKLWYSVNENAPVANLKEQLDRWFQLPRQKYELVADGKVLEGGKTLASYGVAHNSNLTVMPYKLTDPETNLKFLQIFIEPPSVTTLSLKAIPSERVYILKSRMQSKIGTPMHQQRLVFAGKHLEDERTLMDYNIQNGSTIFQY